MHNSVITISITSVFSFGESKKWEEHNHSTRVSI